MQTGAALEMVGFRVDSSENAESWQIVAFGDALPQGPILGGLPRTRSAKCGLPRISAGCGDFLAYWWASEYAIVGFRVWQSGPSRRKWWASVSQIVGFRVTVYKEAREHENKRYMRSHE